MMKYMNHKKILRKQRGLALMFSLGILAVLTVIILIYANRAGIERNVANAYYQGQQAQNLAESAYARAMMHLLGTDNVTVHYYCSQGDPGQETSNPTLSKTDRASLISQQKEASIFDSSAQPQWIYIHENSEDPESPILGRIAYAGVQYQRIPGMPFMCGHRQFCAVCQTNSAENDYTHVLNCTRRNGWGMMHMAWDGSKLPMKLSSGSIVNLDYARLVDLYLKSGAMGVYMNNVSDTYGSGHNYFRTTEEFLVYTGIPFKVGNYSNYDVLNKYLNFSTVTRELDRDCWFAGGVFKAGDTFRGEKLDSDSLYIGQKSKNRYFHRFTLRRAQSAFSSSNVFQGPTASRVLGQNGWGDAKTDKYGGKLAPERCSYSYGGEDAWDQVTVSRIVGRDGSKTKPAHVYDMDVKNASRTVYTPTWSVTGGGDIPVSHHEDPNYAYLKYPRTYTLGGVTDAEYFYPLRDGYAGKSSPVAWSDGRPFKATTSKTYEDANEEVIDDASYSSIKSQDGYYPNQDAWNSMCVPYFANWHEDKPEGGWYEERGANANTDKRNQIVANFLSIGRGNALITDIPGSRWGLDPVFGSVQGGQMPYDNPQDDLDKMCIDYHGKKTVEPSYVSDVHGERKLNEVAVKLYTVLDTSPVAQTVKINNEDYTRYDDVFIKLTMYFYVETVRMEPGTANEQQGDTQDYARICGSMKFTFDKYNCDGTNVTVTPAECTILKDQKGFLMGSSGVEPDPDEAGVTLGGAEAKYGYSALTGADFYAWPIRSASSQKQQASDEYLNCNRWKQVKNGSNFTMPYDLAVANVYIKIPVGTVLLKGKNKLLKDFFKERSMLNITNWDMHLAVVRTNGAGRKAGGRDYAKLKPVTGFTYKTDPGVTTTTKTFMADWQVNDPRHNGLMNQWTMTTGASVQDNLLMPNTCLTLGKGNSDNQDSETVSDPAWYSDSECISSSQGFAYGNDMYYGDFRSYVNLAQLGQVHRAAPWQTINLRRPGTSVNVPQADTDVLNIGGGSYADGDFRILDQFCFVDRSVSNGATAYCSPDSSVQGAGVSFIDMNMPDSDQRDFAFTSLFRGNYWYDDAGKGHKITDSEAEKAAGWLKAAAGKTGRILNRRTDLYCNPGSAFWSFFTTSPSGETLKTDRAQESLLPRVITLTKAEKAWDCYKVYAIGQAIKDVGGKGTTIPISRRSEKGGGVTTVQAQLGKFEEGADLIEGECKMVVDMYYFEQYNQWKILTVRYETE